MAICRYLEELYPEPNLFGVDAWERAQIEQWNRHAELELLLPIAQVFRNTNAFWVGRIKQSAEYGEIMRELVCSRFDWIEGELAQANDESTWSLGRPKGRAAVAKTETADAPPPVPISAVGLPPVDPARYYVVREFARGGLGRILQVRDLRIGRVVALKEILHESEEAYARFVREATITARLEHPSIVPVHDIGRWPPGEPFYSMKLVSGRSLHEIIRDRPSLDGRLALLPNVIAVADAIAYAHSQGIIHRDLKPANVLLGAFGETVVIDWGLAKELRDAGGESITGTMGDDASTLSGERSLTVAGAVMGTPCYMPP